jgi:hypothetical protein
MLDKFLLVSSTGAKLTVSSIESAFAHIIENKETFFRGHCQAYITDVNSDFEYAISSDTNMGSVREAYKSYMGYI